MRPITSLRRHRVAGYAVVLLGLVGAGAAYTAVAGQPGTAAADASPVSRQQIAEGQALFARTCASCHGMHAQGISGAGPSLIGVGAAAVDFQVSTGRMPAKITGAEMPQRPVVFSQTQIHALAAYVASLGGGPAIPAGDQVNPAGANLALGQQLFITNCAQCHNFAGAGGALTYGKSAPALNRATPTQMYEAMQTGPEAMPVFSDTTITPDQKRDIIAYVSKVRSEPDPGGFSLGRVGPVTEGLVAFLGGIAVLIFAAMWITMKRRES